VIENGDGSVGMETAYRLDDREVGVRVSVLRIAHNGYGAHPTSYPVYIWGSFARGKAAGGRETDCSPPTGAKVKET
jgi:hypothetical protein